MTITHHPCSASLMSCSSGSMPEAFAAVMASHISVCPTCNNELALMQEIGTALFDQLTPEPVTRAVPVGAMRSTEADGAGEHGGDKSVAGGDVPQPLVPLIGHTLDGAAWKWAAPGISVIRLPLTDASRGELRLIKVAPGQALPEHGHNGNEMTLVLRGSFSDTNGTYRAGDVADLDHNDEHQPIADAVEGCICLIAVEGKLQFKSRIARFMQPLTGF